MFRKRRLVPLGAVAAALVFGAGVLGAVHVLRAEDTDPGPALVVRPAPSPGVLANLGTASAPIASVGPGRVAVATAPVNVRYTFDGGVGQPITDTAGDHPLRPIGRNGGNLRLVRQGDGLALGYPSRCTLRRAGECPRAILEGRRDDSLNPGRRPMAYGASVRMTPADLADGANVVQKGYSVGQVTQFKLQVDHLQGHPSCVIAGRSRIHRAEPRINVADGAWHDLTCVRSRTRLSLIVDGAVRASVPLPPNLSIANAEPLRIGGKGTNSGNDQFAGQIDNVFLTID